MKPSKDEFSTFDVVRILEISRGRLVHWMNDKFIPPGRDVPWGRGYKTVFSLFDLYGIALFKKCLDLSLSRIVAKLLWQEIEKLNCWDKVINDEISMIVYQYKKGFVKGKDGNKVFKVKPGFVFLESRKDMGNLMLSEAGFFIDLKRIVKSVDDAV